MDAFDDDIHEPQFIEVLDDAGQQDQAADGKGLAAAAEPPPKRASTKPRKPRPKLTAATLNASGGLLVVFEKFPAYFADGFGGKGNEVRDLRRLLQLYQRWQERVFPHCDYDEFIAKLEKLSSSMAMRNDLRQLRQNLPHELDRALGGAAPPQGGAAEEDAPDGGGAAGPSGTAAARAPGREGGGGGARSDAGPDDDELAQMQQEFMELDEELMKEMWGDLGNVGASVAPAPRVASGAPAPRAAPAATPPPRHGVDASEARVEAMMDLRQELRELQEDAGGRGDASAQRSRAVHAPPAPDLPAATPGGGADGAGGGASLEVGAAPASPAGARSEAAERTEGEDASDDPLAGLSEEDREYLMNTLRRGTGEATPTPGNDQEGAYVPPGVSGHAEAPPRTADSPVSGASAQEEGGATAGVLEACHSARPSPPSVDAGAAEHPPPEDMDCVGEGAE